jgi:hypothetical protein
MVGDAVFLKRSDREEVGTTGKKLRPSAASIHCGYSGGEASIFHQSEAAFGAVIRNIRRPGYRGSQSSNGSNMHRIEIATPMIRL